MPRPARLTKAAMAQKLEAVFKENGYEGASLKMLSDAAGLSKASLYHHFPKGKEEMAAHVLAYSGAQLQKHVLAPLGQSDINGLLASLDGAGAYYPGTVPICLMNSLLLGDGRALFGDRIRGAVDAWQKGLTGCLRTEGVGRAEAEAWAADALQRMQGALVLCRVSGNRASLDECLVALKSDVDDWLRAA